MANKKDVERARADGMRKALEQYKSCREHGQDEDTALKSLELTVDHLEWITIYR